MHYMKTIELQTQYKINRQILLLFPFISHIHKRMQKGTVKCTTKQTNQL